MHDLDVVTIPGVIVKSVDKHTDTRGWLMECFRSDEIDKELMPKMSYISVTLPGVVRGPHEHLRQTDYFCFIGTTTFKVYLWDNRKKPLACRESMTVQADEGKQLVMIIPPGVVHAYKNIGNRDGMVLNFPNKLYAGTGKKEKVDEVRYEDAHGSPFKVV